MMASTVILFIFLHIIFLHQTRVDSRSCKHETEIIIDKATWKDVNLTDLDIKSKELNKIISQNVKEPGEIEGGSGDFSMIIERKLYYKFASLTKCVKTICEIGFNGGHSALLWLIANPNAKVIMFDLWEHSYCDHSLSYIRNQTELNPSRLRIVKGNSIDTVRKFHVEYPTEKCDILSVDGSHEYKDALLDIDNMMTLARRHWNLLFVDDTNCFEKYCVDEATREHMRRHNIKLLETFSIQIDRGVSVFEYLK